MLIGTSWKMNKTRPEAVAWVQQVAAGLPQIADQDSVFVLPAFTAIEAVREAAAGTPLLIGAQNVHDQEQGAFTGEVSAAMLAELDCQLVEVGHSERRMLYNETDASVARKVRLILEHNMRPLICVGESKQVRDAGDAVDYVLAQAKQAIGELDADEQAKCLLAYEPVWAIGHGSQPATPEQITPVHAQLKLSFPATPCLYGGSINPGNAAELAAVEGVAGLFVGRAALEAAGFLAVLKAALPN